MSDTIRWLHLSDFHVGKDKYGQICLFEYLLNFVEEKCEEEFFPDFVVITGDVGYSGKGAEYFEFMDKFLVPLDEVLSKFGLSQIFIVPGNHDVDCSKVPTAMRHGVLKRFEDFFDTDSKGKERREILFKRFDNFAENDLSTTGGKWVHAQEGSYNLLINIRGIKVGILGLNTAWLSDKEGNDFRNITPGKHIVEEGLKKLGQCDLKIVLGHHPIDWYIPEEHKPISALFSRHNVIYLHGHGHQSSARILEGAGNSFLSVQSGSAFQERENEQLTNGFILSEYDTSKGNIYFEPYKWSKNEQIWKIDSEAFPEPYHIRGTEKWCVSIPGRESDIRPPSFLGIPDGWINIERNFIDSHRTTLDKERVLKFFDGSVPRWGEALCDEIPKREIVDKLIKTIEAGGKERTTQVTLLLGASGEGKTLAILQTICRLVSSGLWEVIWHNDSDKKFIDNIAKRLPKKEEKMWLIVSDVADIIAEAAFQELQDVKYGKRNDIHFLFCCRDTDWYASKGHNLKWDMHAVFKEEHLRGLSRKDAVNIVKAWGQYGEEGLKHLSGYDVRTAANLLIEAATSEIESRPEDGAFLGAMLRVRYADDLKKHIHDLLLRLKRIDAPGGDLLHAFCYISAMHAENLNFLSKVVLSEVLHCNGNDIKNKIINPLGDEAAGTIASMNIQTRHRAIAETSVEILSNKFNIDFDEIYAELVVSAMRSYSKNEFVPNLHGWRYLSDYFFDRDFHERAIYLAKMAQKEDSSDPFLITKLSSLLRKAGQPEMGAKIFRSSRIKIEDRGFFVEWATNERILENYALAVWLFSISLNDVTAIRRQNNRDSLYSLTGLVISFGSLYNNYNNEDFIFAKCAAAFIATHLRLEHEDVIYFNNAIRECASLNIYTNSLNEAFKYLLKGIERVYEYFEISISELPKWLPSACAFSFDGLKLLIGMSPEVKKD